MRHLLVLGALVLAPALVACTSHEGKPNEATKDPQLDPKPEPEPAVPTAKAVIASVQMIEDCPEEQGNWRPPPAQDTPAAAAPPADEDVPQQAPSVVAPGAAAEPMGDSARGWRQPCTQSTIQVVFSGQGDLTSKVEIQAVKLLDPKSGKEVARLQVREPAAWREGAYQSWDQTIGPKQEVKASYELSVPQWSDVEKVIGTGSSFGYMFALELDVKVGDQVQTVRSPEFPREEPHVVVT